MYTVYLLIKQSTVGYYSFELNASSKEAAVKTAKEQMLAARDDIEIVGFMVF